MSRERVSRFKISLFHRSFIVPFSLLIQILLLILVIERFHHYFGIFYAISMGISILVILWIIYNKSNPAYKIAWIIPICLFPIFGGVFYLFFGGNQLTKREKRKMEEILNRTREALPARNAVIEFMEEKNPRAALQSRYLQNFAHYPPYSDSECHYLSTGEIKYVKLLEELKKAEKFIFLEYFIIDEGIMWDSIREILIDKVNQGVDVRLIYDDIGCLQKLPDRYNYQLERQGIKAAVFNPFIPVLSPRLNNRDHRKIVVIDGITAFTGGVNIADEYINEIERFGHWKDTAVMIKGEAVWNFTVMFLTVWNYLKNTHDDFSSFRPDYAALPRSGQEGFLQPFTDSPLDGEPVGETVYLNLIYKAQKYVYITTPYLVINNEMVTALISAAKSGIDVRIITPYKPDKWYVHIVTRSYYPALIESGVKIYEYTPGFMHAKMFVVDNEYAVVGTINTDFRSLYLHFECGVWIYANPAVLDVKKDFIQTQEQCQEIILEEITRMNWIKVFFSLVLRAFAPLL